MQSAEERGAALAAEVGVLGEELTRVGAVAARATTREIAGGSKDEGVVPVGMHMEEVRRSRVTLRVALRGGTLGARLP